MSLEEFLAWFEGFATHIKGRPEKRDWNAFTAKVDAMDDGIELKGWLLGYIDGRRIKERPETRQWSEIVKRIRAVREAIAAERRKPGAKEALLEKDKKIEKGVLFKTLGKKS